MYIALKKYQEYIGRNTNLEGNIEVLWDEWNGKIPGYMCLRDLTCLYIYKHYVITVLP